MDRYEWTDPAANEGYFVARGEYGITWGDAEFPAEDGPAGTLAAEILRLAARLKEAEELLAEAEWTGDDYTYCWACGRWRWEGHQSDCRLVAFLAAGKEG